MTYALKPLSIGELLDRTFSFYRTNFVLFVGIGAVPSLFIMLLSPLQLMGGSAGPLFIVLASVILVILYCVAALLTQGATVIAVSNIQLGRPASIPGAFAGTWPRLGTLILIALNVSLRVLLGFLLLIVPGIYLAMKYVLALNVTVLEHTNVAQSIKRSADLTKGHRGRIFLIYVMLFGFLVIVSAVMQAVLAILFVSIRTGQPSVLAGIALAFGSFAIQSLLNPIITIASALVYYDERVRKEGFDLSHMMEQLDHPALAPSPGTP